MYTGIYTHIHVRAASRFVMHSPRPVVPLASSCRELAEPTTDSTEITALPKSTKSQHSDSSVQIQRGSSFQFEFVLRDTEESEFLDSMDFGGAALPVETVIHMHMNESRHTQGY